MNKLICLKCGYVGREDDFLVSRYVEPSQHSEIITVLYCPVCSYPFIDNAEQCKICGDYYPEGELIQGYCKYCYDNLKRRKNELSSLR